MKIEEEIYLSHSDSRQCIESLVRPWVGHSACSVEFEELRWTNGRRLTAVLPTQSPAGHITLISRVGHSPFPVII